MTRPSLNVLKRVSAAGGAPTLVTPLGPEMSYFAPWFLPDGKRFLFTATGWPDAADLPGDARWQPSDAADTRRQSRVGELAQHLGVPRCIAGRRLARLAAD